ncbi:MAG: HDOD domain-containing protein [Candidatus Dadabacteria bacterium]|nr:MAG: HDOD domain-containing protein [Candidatus Dadabacteria bacterium]
MSDTSTSSSDTLSRGITSDEFVEKLRRALKRDGDFPASARIVAELRQLVSDPKTTANQITEVILKEPSLGTRVLHLVNSSFYRRAKPIMTVSQAVIQIGMRPLAELCAGLVLLQKFVPAARRGGAFATCLQKTILTSLLSSSLSKELGPTVRSGTNKNDETGYLAGSFYELGTLLLAFYFPQVYETAIKRADAKGQDLSQSIKEITGLSPVDLSIEVIDALDLPDFYKDVIRASDQISNGVDSPEMGIKSEAVKIGKALYAAQQISDVVVHAKNRKELEDVIESLSDKLELDVVEIDQIVGSLPTVFKDHCHSIDLDLPALPEFVSAMSQSHETEGDDKGQQRDEEVFGAFLDEIREAVENKEPTASIITTVMETLAWSLGFDRVLLLLVTPNRKQLAGRMLLGQVSDFDPRSFKRPLGTDASPYAPDAQAFQENRPVFNGDPLFDDGWPIAVLPIGFGQRAIGVIYCDRVNCAQVELSSREQAAIGILAELLDRSVGVHSSF